MREKEEEEDELEIPTDSELDRLVYLECESSKKDRDNIIK